jgi:hypothetical protein
LDIVREKIGKKKITKRTKTEKRNLCKNFVKDEITLGIVEEE